MITIVSGVNKLQKDYAGKTVSQVVKLVDEMLELEGDEVVKVNGVEARGNSKLKDGDSIEFVKEAGEKGATKASKVKIEVSHGVNKTNIDINDGTPVAEVLEQVQEALGIEPGSTVKINGTEAPTDAPVHAGDKVEIEKDAGEKGC